MKNHVCPVWIGYLLVSPIRKLFQNPKKILSPFIKQNMSVLDFGSAMGFFSLQMARLIQPNGKVYSVDIQEKMLEILIKKAKKKKIIEFIETINCKENTLSIQHLTNKIDFALAFAVLHELPDQEKFFEEIYPVLKKGSKLLIAEPIGHVNANDFEKTLRLAKEQNFKFIESPKISKSHSALFEK